MKWKAVLAIAIVAAIVLLIWSRRAIPANEAERNRAFTESMSGVTLVGYSTRLNRPGISGEERYRIDGVSHVSGDTWLFRTRLEVGGKEIPIPMPIAVKWAGDTPVITLTDFSIPGVGTYTARVVLHSGQYAGTWGGRKIGGQLFGKIVRP